ncbi:MAG: zinc finger domain-containing protein [Candidatus Diapherotrites archaeon]|nr:zinc finger domain-containing protein [Candidatus Diapherotrites archaeon]
MVIKKCQTCNREIIRDYIEFKCPACLKTRILRCMDCENKSTPYTCSDCGFKGP